MSEVCIGPRPRGLEDLRPREATSSTGITRPKNVGFGAKRDEPDPDCNGNDWPDDLDIERGLSADINQNGIPDECEVQLGDLNCDGRFDGLDITAFFLALTDPEAYAIVYPDCGPFGSPAGRAGE